MRFLHTLIRNLLIPNNAGVNSPAIVIGGLEVMPADLIAYYAADPLFTVIVGGQINRRDATHYTYDILVTDALATVMARAVGSDNAGTIFEDYTVGIGGFNGFMEFSRRATTDLVMNMHDTAMSFDGTSVNGGGVVTANGAQINISDTASPFLIDGISAPRGFRGQSGTYTGGAIIAQTGGAEVAIPAATWTNEPFVTFINGRLYRVVLRCVSLNTVNGGGRNHVRIRKGSASTGGTEFMKWQIEVPVVANAGISWTGVAYIKNTSGSDVATALSLTNQLIAGAGNAGIYGDTVFKLSMDVDDIGSTGDHFDLAAITASV